MIEASEVALGGGGLTITAAGLYAILRWSLNRNVAAADGGVAEVIRILKDHTALLNKLETDSRLTNQQFGQHEAKMEQLEERQTEQARAHGRAMESMTAKWEAFLINFKVARR